MTLRSTSRESFVCAELCGVRSIALVPQRTSRRLSTIAIVNATRPTQMAMLPGMRVPKSAMGPHAIRSAVTPEITPMDDNQWPTVGEAIGPKISNAPTPNPAKATYLAIVYLIRVCTPHRCCRGPAWSGLL